jgi:hypothetical protein
MGFKTTIRISVGARGWAEVVSLSVVLFRLATEVPSAVSEFVYKE